MRVSGQLCLLSSDLQVAKLIAGISLALNVEPSCQLHARPLFSIIAHRVCYFGKTLPANATCGAARRECVDQSQVFAFALLTSLFLGLPTAKRNKRKQALLVSEAFSKGEC